MAESKGSKGYLIPETIDPQNLLCLLVYIPNDPLYLYAFGGAYERLGTWQVWEKDGTTRASQAAQVWKDAIDYTRENGWIGGCEMLNCCDELIEAINNISMTVNVNVSSGGCGCNVIDNYKFPDNWEDDDETYPTPPPLGTTPPVVVGDEFCNMAHEAFEQMYEMIAGFVAALAEYEPYYSIAEFLNTIAIAAPEAGDIYDAIAKYLLALYGKLVEDSQSYILQLKDEIICIMVNSGSSESATGTIKQLILDSHFIPFTTREWLYALYSSLNLNLLYEGELGYRPEFAGSDCSMCPPMPPTWPNLLFVPVENWNFYAPDQNASVITGSGIITITPSGTGNPQVFPETLPPDQMGYTFAGYYFEIDDLGSGTGRFIADTTTAAPLHFLNLISQTTHGTRNTASSASQDILDFYATNDSNVGVGAVNAQWRAGAENNNSNDPFTFRMWYVYFV